MADPGWGLVPEKEWRRLIDNALAEDLNEAGDVTSIATVPADARCTAVIVAREPCVTAGIPLAVEVFLKCEPSLNFSGAVRDGEAVRAGAVLARIAGSARGVLAAERTALNLLQRLTGVATLTRRYADAVAGLPTLILDTRKTTPGLRAVEKYAVRCGGGANHRIGLYDRVLIKDNHRALLGREGESLGAAVRRAHACYQSLEIEIEVESLDELKSALEGRPDWVLLDNMPLPLMRECVGLCRGRCRTEASGGISLETVRAVAETGVDAISVGRLTHSAVAADLSLEIEA